MLAERSGAPWFAGDRPAAWLRFGLSPIPSDIAGQGLGDTPDTRSWGPGLLEECKVTDDPTPDEIFSEVLQLRRALADLPASDTGARAALESRLTELRALAGRTELDSATDRGELEAHLRRLEQRLRDALDGHVSHGAGALTGRGGGIDPEYVHRLNRQVDEGMGVEELRAEIARIRRRLESDPD